MGIFSRKSISREYSLLDPDEILADTTSTLDVFYSTEGKIERSLGNLASFLFLILIGIGMAYLGVRAASLQVERGDEFFSIAQGNRFFTRPVLSLRGTIYDRSGEALVENYPSFGIIFDKQQFLKGGSTLSEFLVLLSTILGKDSASFYTAGFPENHDTAEIPERILIARDIDPDAIVAVAPRLAMLPGVQIFESSRRVYRDPFAFSHLMGFTGKVSREELASNSYLREEETIGKSGIELSYDDVLRGERGKKIVEIDSAGNETRFKLTHEPKRGSDIILTIDGSLQEIVYKTIMDYTSNTKGASVVVLDPQTGAVRTLVSVPGFNTNKFGYSLSQQEFQLVLQNPLKPLFNRAVSGEFPSGSTLKPFIGAAALEENIIDPLKQIYDEGFISLPNPYDPEKRSIFLDWKKHGWVDFYDAIAQSANVYFYMIGGGFEDQKGLGIELIKEYMLRFGFGSNLGIDLPGERDGLIPDPEWKKVNEPNDPVWRVGDTYNVSIGQGGVKTTPLQMVAAVSAVANGGTLYRPYVLDAFLNTNGDEEAKTIPIVIRDNIVSKESLAHVVRGMRRTVTEGTARLLSGIPVAIAAKTGTAQVGGSVPPHAWVIAFAPVDDPEIAIVVMVEHAGEGSTVAMPITRDILQWYFENRADKENL